MSIPTILFQKLHRSLTTSYSIQTRKSERKRLKRFYVTKPFQAFQCQSSIQFYNRHSLRCLVFSKFKFHFISIFTAWLYRKNSYTEFFARAQFIKDFLSRIRDNFSKPGSVSNAKMLRIPLIFGITFFFWTIKGTACQISSFMYHFRPYSLFKVSSSSTL